MKNRYLVLLCGWICALGLTSCDHYMAEVSLDDAMTQFGRINSHNLPIGTVLLWHRKTNEIDQFTSIPKSSLPLERIPLTGTQEQTVIKGVSETDIAITTPPLSGLPLDTKTTIGIKAAIGSETSLELDQYYFERYDGKYSLPNDPSTVAWRQQNLKGKLVDPDLIFVFVVADTSANEAKFYSGTPTDDKGNAKALDNSLTIGGDKIVDVSYTGGSSITQKGAGIPAIVKYRYYTLGKDNEGATGYAFKRIHGDEIDQQFIQALRSHSIE
jgi:hypothetical protein